jgi:uncharacterized membrane protein
MASAESAASASARETTRPVAGATSPRPEPAPRPRLAAPPLIPSEPPPPDLFDRAYAAARGWLVGGNPVLRIGVVLLFLGLAFLLRYASERGLVPIELRYAGVAAAGAGMLGLGWWLRRRNLAYALILQGTGVAVLYLTIFAAIRLHPLIPAKLGLVLLIAVTIALTLLAVLQNARGLAIVATIGGFAAPLLASTGSGNHVALFIYLAVLNTGILGIAWWKAWRPLNMIGFVGTFGIGLAWGLRSYKPELFASTQPFLALFFLMYVGIGVLFARRRLLDASDPPTVDDRVTWLAWSRQRVDYVDGTVVFGPPMVGFGLQVAIVADFRHGAAISAAALALFYFGLARLLAHKVPGRVVLLVDSCLALGVVFATLAIPLAVDARWTSAAWAVEGAGLYWLGLRQGRPLARVFALLVQLAAAFAYLSEVTAPHLTSPTLLRGVPAGALMLGASLLFGHDRVRRSRATGIASKDTRWLPPLLACAGLAFIAMIAPLCLAAEGTAIAWALGGLVTLFVGLRLRSRAYLVVAIAVQVLGGLLFLLEIDPTGSTHTAAFTAGWRGLISASTIGLALVAGVILAARDPLVRDDPRLIYAVATVLLIGLGFVNLAVLFVLPFATASAVWGGTGLLILWLSLQLRQRATFMFALVLQVFAAATFLLTGPSLFTAPSGAGLRPLMHIGFWTPCVLAVVALIGAWRLHRAATSTTAYAVGPDALAQLSTLLMIWGGGWWATTGASEVLRFVPLHLQGAALLLVAALSVAVWTEVAARTRWPALALMCLTLTPVAAVALISLYSSTYHPIAALGWLAWPVLLVVHLFSLARLANFADSQLLRVAHVLGCWVLLGVLALEQRYLLAGQPNAYRWLGWALIPTLYLLLMATPRRLPWPVAAYNNEYRLFAALPLAAISLLWFWTANVSAGDADPLPYLPLLNPLELGMMLALFAAARWSREALPQLGAASDKIGQPLRAVVGTSLFALVTAAVLRTAHHFAGIEWDIDALLATMMVQAGLSIVWTLVALGLMISGHMQVRRVRWIVGASLIGVVVIKLFFVELDNSGGLARIISFIGVGVLLLIVGYFAPLPPRKPTPPAEEPPKPL